MIVLTVIWTIPTIVRCMYMASQCNLWLINYKPWLMSEAIIILYSHDVIISGCISSPEIVCSQSSVEGSACIRTIENPFSHENKALDNY